MNTNRGTFLAGAAAGAAIIAGAAAADASEDVYDRSAMNAILHRPAKHHLIIGSPRINGIAAMRSSAHIMGAYQFAFGEGPGTVAVIVSLYGPSSIMMLMNDEYWAKYKAYELVVALRDMPPGAIKGPHNPFYHAHSTMNPHDDPKDVKGFWHDYSVEAVTKRGVKWFICNEAMHTAARQLEELGDGSAAGNLARMKSHLLPGTLIVPSGSQALVVAQELRYTYQAG